MEQILDDHKALDINVIDIHDKAAFADYMIVATGTSSRHVDALSHHLEKEFSDLGYKGISVEGKPYCDWIVVDLIDAIVHIFKPEVRELYQLDKLWTLNDGEKAEG